MSDMPSITAIAFDPVSVRKGIPGIVVAAGSLEGSSPCLMERWQFDPAGPPVGREMKWLVAARESLPAEQMVTSLCFNSRGNQIVLGCVDGSVQLRNGATLAQLSIPAVIPKDEAPHGDEPKSKRVKVEPPGGTAVAAAAGEPREEGKSTPMSLCFLANDGGIVALDFKSRLHVASVDGPLLMGAADPSTAPVAEWLTHFLARSIVCNTDAWDVCMAVRVEEIRVPGTARVVLDKLRRDKRIVNNNYSGPVREVTSMISVPFLCIGLLPARDWRIAARTLPSIPACLCF